ncbi:hypothetical protein MTR67_024302 [Solanum verrucosum]|uniref:WRKY domain-containing protein n=1 Tax=Solanum verrucosum TaxID=315347 RepID=A0AAF0QYK9_SOLVR|nr:hypothetical protein MTR67_024302 [Solanum verrucosum]
MKQDVCRYLAAEILSSYDKAMSLLNGIALSVALSAVTAPLNPGRDNFAYTNCNHYRKMLAPRAEYVEARHGEEVPPEDGFNWRKYGQKLILGAKYPREYFQCVCRHCDATKMVQQMETEPLTFEVTYGESHSCGQENKNQNEELLVAVGTQVGRAAGKLSECYIPEMVTPNNSYKTKYPSDITYDTILQLFSDQPSYIHL